MVCLLTVAGQGREMWKNKTIAFGGNVHRSPAHYSTFHNFFNEFAKSQTKNVNW
jgi:hypothetical protein